VRLAVPATLRSFLFAPATRPERVVKALASAADAVIVDLEDAVAPAEKVAARAMLADHLPGWRPLYLRINGCGTEWFEADLALAAAAPNITGVMLPKAESAADIERLQPLPPAVAVLPLIETARGLHRAEAVAAHARVERLAFGSIDFQLDTSATDEELIYARSQLVVVSRACGLAAPVDGVTTELDDAGKLQADIARARRLGFGGKLCIHPRQLAAVAEAFVPRPEEVEWAEGVVRAASSSGVAAVDGRMVDRPVLLRAQRILADAGRSRREH
jgi:citrate lyase subunit beta/citryl-CoA lyase